MIDVMEWMIDTAEEVDELDAVYQTYPRKIVEKGAVAIIMQTGRMPVTHAHGEEVVTQLTFQVDVLAPTQTAAREISDAIANKYTANNGEVTGWSVSYDETYQRYATTWSVSVTVDKRGTFYH